MRGRNGIILNWVPVTEMLLALPLRGGEGGWPEGCREGGKARQAQGRCRRVVRGAECGTNRGGCCGRPESVMLCTLTELVVFPRESSGRSESFLQGRRNGGVSGPGRQY